MESDILERAEAAWQAGSAELDRIGKLPGGQPENRGGGRLVVGDQLAERAPIHEAASELAVALGVLRQRITTAKDAGPGLAIAERNLKTQVAILESLTPNVRALREKYVARWGAGR